MNKSAYRIGTRVRATDELCRMSPEFKPVSIKAGAIGMVFYWWSASQRFAIAWAETRDKGSFQTFHEPSDWETVVVIDAEPAMGGRTG